MNLKQFFRNVRQSLFKFSFESKICNGKHFRKRFCSYLEVINECSERLKIAFCTILIIFEWRNWEYFLRKMIDISFYSWQFQLFSDLRKWSYSNFLKVKNEWSEPLEIALFQYLPNVWIIKVKLFEKAR